MGETNEQIAMRVSRNSIYGNVVLSAFKLFAGIFAHSSAMVSDAVHSLSDVLSTIIVMIGVKLAGMKSDKDHPYGHERFECVAAIILAAILFVTGIAIGWGGVQKIISPNYSALSVPGALALVAAITSIIVKEAMYWYTLAAANKTGFGALKADAWHHRSDALSSVGSFIGILGARLGFPILDPVASVVICLFILKVAYDIFMESIGKMTDKACDDALADEIRALILEQAGVKGIDLMHTRLFGDKIYVDVEISADGDSPLHVTHDIAHCVHDAIETKFSKVKHCMVHVNPADAEDENTQAM